MQNKNSYLEILRLLFTLFSLNSLQLFILHIILAIAKSTLFIFVFVKLWHWFFVPMGISEISPWQAGGLIVFVSFIRFNFVPFSQINADTSELNSEEAIYQIVLDIITNFAILFIGYGFSRFMTWQ